jgi:hypothetical protein
MTELNETKWRTSDGRHRRLRNMNFGELGVVLIRERGYHLEQREPVLIRAEH